MFRCICVYYLYVMFLVFFIVKDYLETKRLVFARFYFLSNEDLLDILANCKNPNAVQVCKPSYTLTNPLFSPGTEQVFSVKIRVGDKSLGMSFGGWGVREFSK